MDDYLDEGLRQPEDLLFKPSWCHRQRWARSHGTSFALCLPGPTDDGREMFRGRPTDFSRRRLLGQCFLIFTYLFPPAF